MTTTEFLQRQIRRTELAIRQAHRKPNTPLEEIEGLCEKLKHLQDALKAVEEHWQRVHEQRGWTAGEPLTVEQLRGMDKPTPVWMEADKKTIEGWGGYWCICQRGHILTPGMVSMYADKMDGATFYSYPPAHIDREKWVECARCRSKNREPLGYDGANDAVSIVIGDNAAAIEADSFGFTVRYCPKCGRPLTEEAWAELERRVCGG